jgi:peroxiredoxin
VRGGYDAIRAAGGEALLVVQAIPALLAVFLKDHPLPFPAVSDPTRAAYRAFGLERTTWGRMLRPRVMLRGLRLMFRGWLPQRSYAGEDVLQLGGDFVLDAEGRVSYAYGSADPADRPGVDVLVRAISAARK